jgi:indolepyruvate decarboxylase
MAERPRYTVARYIIDRLYGLGVRHIFQVPGNYTAQFLIQAEASGRLRCVGTTNEMEAGYAADAYARLNGIGVVCTTYGVGSFSLYNAIAGAYVERCPVVLINGGPSRQKFEDLEDRGILFAHAIDTIRTDEKIFREITAATAVVTDPEDAPRQIDHVLRTCITLKQPVYLESRDGVWDMECSPPADTGVTPFPLNGEEEAVTGESVDAAVTAVIKRLIEAKSPVLWGGEELQRLNLEDKFEELIGLTGFKYSTTLMGKSLVRETPKGDPTRKRDEFIGVYDSVFAPSEVGKVFEKSDCVLALGTILSDFYGKIVRVTQSSGAMILAAGAAVRVGHAIYPNVPLDRFVQGLIRALKRRAALAGAKHAAPEGFERLRPAWIGGEAFRARSADPAAAEVQMSWADAFVQIQKHVNKDTIVLVDTSLALFPSAELLIPSRNHFIAQTAWLSIGYTIGAAVGVSTLLKENERVLVLAGDGGFQMTAQALATLAKLRKPVTVVVFDNALYAIEQFLVVTQIVPDQLDYYAAGSTRRGIFFNQLEIDATSGVRWDYVALAKAFRCEGVAATTPMELDRALGAATKVSDRPTLISARINPRSVPPELVAAIGTRPATFRASPDESRSMASLRLASRAFD